MGVCSLCAAAGTVTPGSGGYNTFRGLRDPSNGSQAQAAMRQAEPTRRSRNCLAHHVYHGAESRSLKSAIGAATGSGLSLQEGSPSVG
jgi:hypothetical protein